MILWPGPSNQTLKVRLISTDLIASLLLAQITGMNVGRRAFNLVCLFLQGWADADELAEGLARIQASQSPRKSH